MLENQLRSQLAAVGKRLGRLLVLEAIDLVLGSDVSH